ncbi:MAG: hypothetical protein KDD46_01350 [Bdellovibrionales bacterium]|nr:hypothetical protein [Bdellovibrionales bacterium]
MVNKFAIVFTLLFCVACANVQNFITGYKAYRHPSLQFEIVYPKSWKVVENGSFGTQVQFLSSQPGIFLANANVTVNRSPDLTLDEIADLSVKQLSILLKGYEIKTKALGHLGKQQAVDLRAIYEGAEGPRLIRSVISIINEMQYVFTFTCEASKEREYEKTINKMIDSFTVKP